MGWKGKRESYWQKGQQDMAALIDRTVKDQAWDGVAETIPVLAQRAVSEGPRWTRSIGVISAPPW